MLRPLLSLILILCIGCSKKDNSEPISLDTTTSASIETNNWIPPLYESYQVLGYKEGIKGVVIRYSDSLYRGGDIVSSAGANYLKALGIKTVISVTPSDQIRSLCKTYGLSHVELPFDYQGITQEIKKEYINILRNEEPPLYIHCYSGKQRGGNLIVLYRSIVDHWDFEAAMREYELCGGKPDQDRKILRELYQ